MSAKIFYIYCRSKGILIFSSCEKIAKIEQNLRKNRKQKRGIMELEEAIKNLQEIVNLYRGRVNNSNINTIVVLSPEDLKSLQIILQYLEEDKQV